jgi:uncharacterized repeat protein (TIGR01451 family)
MFRSRRCAFLLSVLLFQLAVPFAGATTYTVVPAAVPRNINNLGQSVNGCDLWSGGVNVYLSPFFNVASPEGVGPCETHGISDDGYIVGWTNDWDGQAMNRGCTGEIGFGGQPAAAGIRNGALDCFGPFGQQSKALGVSANGIAVGAEGDWSAPDFHAFVKESTSSSTTRLQDLIPFASHNFALDANDSGDIVGYAYAFDPETITRTGPDRAVLWQNGVPLDLGTLGGDAARAVAVNDSSQIVGNAQLADGTFHAFLWQSGVMTDLGAFEATAINGAGQIVGEADGRAVIWDNGTLTDLNDLIPPGSGWLLTRTTAINDAGRIGGQGVFDGATAGFQLFPDSLPLHQANLALAVVPFEDPMAPPARFGFTLTNQGVDNANGTALVVKVHDTSCPVDDGSPCPSGIQLTLSQGSCFRTTNHGFEANVPTSIWCDVGSLAAGQSVTGELVWSELGELTEMTVDATLFAVELDPDTTDNSASVTVQRAVADIGLSLADSPDPVLVGQPLTYTAAIANFGPDAAGNVRFSSATPAGTEFVSATSSQGSCSGTTFVFCEMGRIELGENAGITLVVTPTQSGTIIRSASASTGSLDQNTANNAASTSTTVNSAADLAITMTDSPDPVKKRRELTYAINVVNNGPSTASGVVVTDALPPDVIFMSATSSQGSCSGTATVTCELGSLASGAGVDVTIVIKPTSVGTLSNTADVTGSDPDPDAANNSATATTIVANSVK